MENKEVLKENIEYLVNIDQRCKVLLEQLNELKSKKYQIETKINDIISKHNLENKTFVLNDNKIQQKKTIQYQNLSLKYIEDCLKNYVNSNGSFNIEQIINTIKMNREKKIKYEIKIY
jgi:hypothetical protein